MVQCKVPCTADEICNPETGKCVKRSGRVGQRLLSGVTKKKTPKTPKGCPPCGADEICNPVTGKCVKKSGRVGQKLLGGVKQATPKAKTPKGCPPCGADEICNPVSGKCVKKSGRIGKKLLETPSKRKSPKRKSPKRKSPKRKSPKRKSPKRKSPKRKSPKTKTRTKNCKPGFIRHPTTGECIDAFGEEANRLKIALGTKLQKDNLPIFSRTFVPKPKKPIQGVLTPAQKIGDCLKNSKVPLSYSQSETVKVFNKQDSLLVVHGTGMGKTLIAVAASKCYLDQFPDHRVVVISPTSLLGNLKKEMVKFGRNIDDRYSFYSFEKYLSLVSANEATDCSDTLLIIDEAHNLRNYKSIKYEAAMTCAMRANKVLLLTATPFVNNFGDFIPIINLLYKRYIVGPRPYPGLKTVKDSITNKSIKSLEDDEVNATLGKIGKYLKNKVSFAPKRKEDENFPSYKVIDKEIVMTKKYQEDFDRAIDIDANELFRDPTTFYHGYRKAVNKLGGAYFSQKMKFIVENIGKKQALIYSTWLEFGIEPIKKILDDSHISFGVITGDSTKTERDKTVAMYNNGELQVLVFSKAGSEGIDLKGTRQLYVLDPPWNPALLEQIIGRSVRYRSHSHLPPDQRHVDIYLLSLIERNIEDPKDSHSGDVILYRIIRGKETINTRVEDLLKRISVI